MSQPGDSAALRLQRIEALLDRLGRQSNQAGAWIGYQREQNRYVNGKLERIEARLAAVEQQLAATAQHAVEAAPEPEQPTPAAPLPEAAPFAPPPVTPEPIATLPAPAPPRPEPLTQTPPESTIVSPQPVFRVTAERPETPPRLQASRGADSQPPRTKAPVAPPNIVDRFIERITSEAKGIQLPTIDFQLPTSREGIEQLVGRRLLALIGGIAILIGAAFFLSLAFSDAAGQESGPFFSDTAYFVIGIVVSALMVGLGAWAFERREPILGHVVVASGLAIYSMTLLSGAPAIIPLEMSLTGLLLGALAAAVIAIRASSQVVAAFGLLSTLIAPPLLGAQPDGITVAYVGIMLVGTTAIALYRGWNWLPAIAFLLAAPQFLFWIDSGPAPAVGLTAAAGFWLINALAAGGEEFRIRRRRLWFTSATLLLLNAAVALAAGFFLLQGELEVWRGAMMAGLALGHLLIGGYFMRTEGHRNPFGLLAFGTGLAIFSAAIPVQLGGSAVPIVWAAEAAALAWVFNKLRNRYSIAAGALLGAGAVAHLLLFVYQPTDILRGNDDYASALALAAVLGAAALAGYFVNHRLTRRVLGIGGFALLVYALPFNLSGAWLVGGWSLLSVVALAGPRRLPYRHLLPGGYPMIALGGLASLLAGLHLFLLDYPFYDIGVGQPSEWPFISMAGLAALFLLAGRAVSAYLSDNPHVRLAGTMTTLALPLYVLPFELSTAGLIGGWALIFAAAMIDPRRIPFLHPIPDRFTLLPIAGIAATLALGHLLLIEYPVDLIRAGFDGHYPFLAEQGLALGFILAAITLAGWLTAFRDYREFFAIAGLLLATYAMPFEISGVALIAGWAALSLLALVERRHLPFPYPSFDHLWLPLASVIPALLAACNLLVHDYPLASIDEGLPSDIPFWHAPGLALAILLAACGLGAWLTRERWLRAGFLLAGAGLLIWALPFELSGPALIATWALLAVIGLAHPARLPIPSLRRFAPRSFEPYMLVPAALAGALALLHLLALDFPLNRALDYGARVTPLFNPAVSSLVIVLFALWLAGYLSAERRLRLGLTLAGYGLVLYALPFELSGAPLVGAWLLVGLLALVDRDRLPFKHPFPLPSGLWALIPTGATAVLALLHLTFLDLPWWDLLAGPQTPRLPLWNEASLTAGLVILAAAVAALLARQTATRHVAILLGMGVAAYLAPFQFAPASTAILWAAIGLLPYAFARLDSNWRTTYYVFAGGLVAMAAAIAIVNAAPPSRLLVQAGAGVDHPLLFSGATAALGALIINLLVALHTFRERSRLASLLVVATGALGIYLLSIGMVDEFQRRVGDGGAVDVLREQASVALSILWTLLGVGALVVGAWRRIPGLRLFGLGVLAVAILKVFIVDLASVDTSRKFLSFIILGVLLLLSSFVYQKLGRDNGNGAPRPAA